MQEGLRAGDGKHDLPAVVERINRLAQRVRDRGGRVVFIQHEGGAGDDFAPGAPGGEIMDDIKKMPADHVVAKTLNDAFRGTTLASTLEEIGAGRILVSGWATDLCVDSTVRSAAALGYRVVVVSDSHTVSDRPHMDAEKVIEHHHWVWRNLISDIPVTIAGESEL
jgi:nicotinamidase-related amidase